jgi:hypothetical protein
LDADGIAPTDADFADADLTGDTALVVVRIMAIRDEGHEVDSLDSNGREGKPGRSGRSFDGINGIGPN